MDLFGRYANRPGSSIIFWVDFSLTAYVPGHFRDSAVTAHRQVKKPAALFRIEASWCFRTVLAKPAVSRYRINPASLRFIPVDQLESKGYGSYRHLFQHQVEE